MPYRILDLKILTMYKISFCEQLSCIEWGDGYQIFYFYVATSLVFRIFNFMRTSFFKNNSWDDRLGLSCMLICEICEKALRQNWLNMLLFFCFQALIGFLKSSRDHFLARITIAAALLVGRGVWRDISDMNAVLCRASSVLIASIAASSKPM